MPFMPKIHMPKRSKGQRIMRGRPITPEEYEKMVKTVPEVRPHDAVAWQHYLQGLWLSGLRLEESLVLSWDEDAPISIDLTGRRPRLRIYAEAEKGNRDRLLPMAPDFAAFLLRYYVDLDADEMAEELSRMSGSINTFINTPSLEHKKDEKESG